MCPPGPGRANDGVMSGGKQWSNDAAFVAVRRYSSRGESLQGTAHWHVFFAGAELHSNND